MFKVSQERDANAFEWLRGDIKQFFLRMVLKQIEKRLVLQLFDPVKDGICNYFLCSSSSLIVFVAKRATFAI